MTAIVRKIKNSGITVTDQFCGAGGSSQGVRNVGARISGIEVKLALNHWQLAIDTHNTNFPDTLHDCTDVSACEPRRYPSTDILITSPECTNHSLAKGQKQVKNQMDLFASGKLDASAERSRATMWDVPRFAEYHNYNIIIVENVVDARKWVMFDAWIMAMHALGYNHKQLYLNSMHFFPCPQSRDRMYVVFWKKGNPAPKLDHTPAAYCNRCGQNVNGIQSWKKPNAKYGKYRTQYVYNCSCCGYQVEPYYYAAFNAIDWSDIGTRIGDRKKPLSINTVKRINYGLNKFGGKSMVLHSAYSDKARGVVKPLAEAPLFTQTTFESQAIAMPMVVNDQHTTGVGFRVRAADDRMDTVSTQQSMKLVVPFIIKGEHTLAEGYAKSVEGPFQTQTVRQSMAVVTPFVVENKGQSNSREITDPLATVTTKNYHGIISTEAWKSFIAYNYNGNQCSNITEPTDAVTTKDRMALIQYETPKIEDCYYRMIKAPEVKLAMAFDRDYIILGNSRDQVKQCGNAVTPPVMEWIVEQCINSLM